jgi:hypothetical protein
MSQPRAFDRNYVRAFLIWLDSPFKVSVCLFCISRHVIFFELITKQNKDNSLCS